MQPSEEQHCPRCVVGLLSPLIPPGCLLLAAAVMSDPLSAAMTASRLSGSEYVSRVQAASEYVRSSLVSCGLCSSASSVASSLCVGVVLGSGLSDFTRLLHRPLLLDYANIPFMPRPAVSGHHGQLLIARIPHPSAAAAESETDTTATVSTTTSTASTDSTQGSAAGRGASDSELLGSAVDESSPLVLCFSGRVHSYEGHLSSSVCFITRLCSSLGVRCMLYTNSAGGSGPGMAEGSVMLIVDHIRACSLNAPLDCCADARLGRAAIDCSSSPLVYSRSLHPVAHSAASACGVQLHSGVYQWSCGPTYESHAEVRAGMRQNVSAFGMSTVPEVLSAASLGLPTMALSLCTNLAAGLSDETLTHEAVKAVANLAGPRFTRLVHNIVHGLHVHFTQLQRTSPPQSPIDQPPSTALDTTAVTTTTTTTATEDVGVSRVLSLRPPVGWQPSSDELKSGARVLLDANVGHPTPLVVLQLPASAAAASSTPLPSSLAPLLSSVRYVPLSDLPSLRQWPHSRTSVHGWLLLATERHSSTRIALLTSPTTEGLTASEAAYLIQLLSLIGARAFVQLADAVTAPPSSASTSTSTSTSTAASSFPLLVRVSERRCGPLHGSAARSRPSFSVRLRCPLPGLCSMSR